jgi:DNA-binding CsgD family transcriptional regulator
MREPGSVELIEREPSLVAIDSALDEGRARGGPALLIEGPAGIGKTALLGEAQQRAGGFMVLRAGGGEFERDLPLGVVRQLFEPVLWHATDRQRERWLRGPSDIAGRLWGVGGAAAHVGESVQGDAAAVRAAFYWLAVALAEDSPLLLLIDDLHWADRESVRWLLFTVRRLAGTGIAVVAATRLREPGADDALLEGLVALDDVALARLAPLSARGSASFVTAWSDSPVTGPEFATACHELSGGNPFLLSELLREASRAGLEPDADGARRLGALVPAGLARAVLPRLRTLGPDALAVARAVAIMSSGVPVRRAALLADVSADEASAAADALVRAGVLRDSEELEIAHPLVRAAILSDLTSARRTALHGRAARVLAADDASAEVVGVHLLSASPSGDQSVVEQLLAAADSARGRGAPDAAARLLQRALEEPPAGPQLPAVQAALGSALCTAGDSRGLENVRIARELTADPVQRAMLALRLATPYFVLGAGDAVETIMRATLDELGDCAPPLAFGLKVTLATAPSFGARFDPRTLVAELLEAASHIDDRQLPARVALAVLSLTACQAAVPAPVVAAIARRAIGDLDAHRNAIAQGFPLLPAVAALAVAEQSDPLEERFALIEDGVQRRGALALGLSILLFTRGMWELHRGVLDAALEHARAATEVTAETPFPVLRAQSLVLLGDALRSCGELREAEVTLADRPRDESVGVWAAAAHAELAAIALERANHSLALQEALFAGELAEPIGVVNPAIAPWRSLAALALRAAGDTARAARLADEQLEHARAFGAPGTTGAALRVQALVLDDLELLAQAERVLSGSAARLEHAQALVDLGAALRRHGERARSREPLAAGLEISHRCGARPLAERALTELRAAGARPRSIVRTGVDALTPSERRIAELAAAGHTNREIGGELFVTKATVETHLRSVFRKLDVHSRDELAARLGAP